MFGERVIEVTDGKLTITGYSHFYEGYGSCHSIARVTIKNAPPLQTNAVSGEFFFGTAMPADDVILTDNAILDPATAYGLGEQGLSYGWDCAGSATFSGPVIAGRASGEGTAVDYTSGTRAPPREVYGMNHFDRHGACVSGVDADGFVWDLRPVNWHVGLPLGYYTVEVDFAADSTNWDNCAADAVGEDAVWTVEVEGVTGCWHRPGCVYSDTVLVTDGALTVTGYSHYVAGPQTCKNADGSACNVDNFQGGVPSTCPSQCTYNAPTADYGSCHSIARVLFAAASPPPPASGEFYFGSQMPTLANSPDAVLGDFNTGYVLDDGMGYSNGRSGFDYGWDCDGSATFSGPEGPQNGGAGNPVDYSSGTRDPPRVIYGMNHFDRHGACVSGVDADGTDWGLRPVNWNVGVTNGFYDVQVNFADDSTGWDNCATDAQGEGALWNVEVEGEIACYHKPGCIYEDVVWVTDGALTITGYSHYFSDYGSCHSIAKVGFRPSFNPLSEVSCAMLG